CRSSENFAASASSFSPSWNATFGRSLMVTDFPSGAVSCESASCGTTLSFSSISNSLSQIDENTIRPTYVRASVGSRMSGSSARPMRSVVCACALTPTSASNKAKAAILSIFMTIPSWSFGRRVGRPLLWIDDTNPGIGPHVRIADKGRHQALERRRETRALDRLGRRQFADPVAGGGVTLGVEIEPRLLDPAAFDGERAAGVEPAARRRRQRAGQLPPQNDALALDLRVRHRNGGEQSPAVGMARR